MSGGTVPERAGADRWVRGAGGWHQAGGRHLQVRAQGGEDDEREQDVTVDDELGSGWEHLDSRPGHCSQNKKFAEIQQIFILSI